MSDVVIKHLTEVIAVKMPSATPESVADLAAKLAPAYVAIGDQVLPCHDSTRLVDARKLSPRVVDHLARESAGRFLHPHERVVEQLRGMGVEWSRFDADPGEGEL